VFSVHRRNVNRMAEMTSPLQLIWKARLTPKKKYILLVMFSGGFFVIVAGLLRCILILTVSHPRSANTLTSENTSYDTSHHSPSSSRLPSRLTSQQAGADGPMKAGEWSVRESFIAVTVGNLPMLYSLFQRATRNTWLRRTLLGKSSDDGSYPLGSRRTGELQRGKKHQHPLSMPNDSTWGSDERIVLPTNTTVTEIRPSDAKDGSLNGRVIGRDDFPAGNGITVVTDWSVKSSKK